MTVRWRGARADAALAVAMAIAGACASPGIPPGGPPDDAPPGVRAVSPDSNAINVRARSVLIHFDEVISERSTPVVGARGGSGGRGTPGAAGNAGTGGAAPTGLAGLLTISPSDGREEVHWRRTALELEPRRGFRPNTTYRITLHPGVGDLRGNVLQSGLEFVFSTGAQIPTGTIGGAVFDWGAGKAAPGARVEVFIEGDSALRWGARADSTGRFTVRDLSPGRYSVRGWVDQNGDRRLDAREISDTATLTLDAEGRVDLYVFARDTLTPRLSQVEARDSVSLRVRFDRAVAADWSPAGAVRLLREDSSLVATGILVSASAVSDSVPADSAPADTVPADTVPADPAPPDSARADTTPRGPVFARTLPVTDWILPLDSVLAPGTYRLVITGVRGLNGHSGDTDREVRIRPPAPPPQTPPDSQGVVPLPSVPPTGARTDTLGAPRRPGGGTR